MKTLMMIAVLAVTALANISRAQVNDQITDSITQAPPLHFAYLIQSTYVTFDRSFDSPDSGAFHFQIENDFHNLLSDALVCDEVIASGSVRPVDRDNCLSTYKSDYARLDQDLHASYDYLKSTWSKVENWDALSTKRNNRDQYARKTLQDILAQITRVLSK